MKAIRLALLVPILCLAPAVPGGSALADDASNGARDSESPSGHLPQTGLRTQASDLRRPATLRRLVRHFDFEEAEHAPFEMPIHFYRYAADDGAAAQGFPPFGSMRLTNEVAYSGRWSFEFELDGGSLAARVPTAVIPIMPMADYVVVARVRTEGLDRARARIGAWLYDQHGNAINESRTHSALINTNGRWETIAVHVRGRYEHAADLAIELQLLQPRHFAPHRPRGSAFPGPPLLEDVRGRAWFDDVTVWHVPRIEMSVVKTPAHGRASRSPGGTPPPANAEERTASITMMVLDLAHDELKARLRVHDVNGLVAYDRAFPAPRTPIPRTIEVPLERYGWYRAVLDVSHDGEATARRTIDFIHAPSAPQRAVPPNAPTTIAFAMAMPESWRHRAAALPMMARQAGASTLILPVLTRDMTLEAVRDLHADSRSAIEQLRRDGVGFIFALSSVPEELSRHLGIAGDDVLAAIKADASAWREYLDALLANFGSEIDRWQLGPTAMGATTFTGEQAPSPHGAGAPAHVAEGDAFWHDDLADILAIARRSLARFVPEPITSIPIHAEHARLPRSGEDGRTITIPYHVRPEAIGDLIRAEPRTLAVLDLPPGDLYEPRERVADLALRVLHAWRSGAPAVAIAPPWIVDQDDRLMPEPMLGPWRTLTAHLAARRFAGELALGPGLHAWIVEGPDGSDAALVAWRDKRSAVKRGRPSAPVPFSMQLAERDVTLVDLHGNARTIPLLAGEHTVTLDDVPVFIEGISAPLVKFRGGFALDPPFIPAELRAHEHAIVLRNPWSMPISGTIQIAEDSQWRLTPRSQDFMIRANEEIRLPVQIVLDRSIIAGRKSLRGQIDLTADGNYRLNLETEIEVGLEDVDVSATWQVARNVQTGEDDLVITQYISNKGAPGSGRAINADAFVIAPGVRQERRLVSGLEPGELAVRSFHIPGGAELLAGRTIRLGLASRDTPARLNLMIEIPARDEMITQAQQ